MPIQAHYTDSHAPGREASRRIRYADGTQELYDRRADPREFHNLAGKPEQADRLRAFRARLPQVNVEPVAGSAGSGSLLKGVK